MGKIYISGKVTGDPDFRSKFHKAEKFLKRKGYKVVNPVKWEKDGKSWKYYLIKDIKKLLKCDTVYLLPDWGFSKGAQLERNIACALDYHIVSGEWSDLDDIR